MRDVVLRSMNRLGLAWWVEVRTENPVCLYYFGPFKSNADAAAHQSGYLEDLSREGATNIQAEIKRCQPKELTVYDEAQAIPTKISR